MDRRQRFLLVVSGPSGIGKDTVVKKLIEAHRGIELSVSATTRPPRGGEAQGALYYYISEGQFKQKIGRDEFVEYTRYSGHYYGTLKSEVEKRITNGVTCVLVIEVNGAAAVKKAYPGCTTVFLTAPSPQEHERRLRSRGTESEEGIKLRMQIAEKEMEMAAGYDFCLVNEDAGVCAGQLYSVLKKRQEDVL